MEKLSKKVFISIISYLNFSDKVNCILVSKKWNQVISRNYLYKAVTFGRYPNDLVKGYKLFIEKEYLGRPTQQLSIYDCHLSSIIILSLPIFFPNLKRLSWNNPTTSSEIDFPAKSIYGPVFEKWKNLESIFTSTTFPIAAYILESSTFAKLTTLSIDFTRDGQTRPPRNETADFVKSVLKNIKNAPALQNIRFKTIVLDLNDMENLHRDAPLLEKLELVDAGFGNLTNRQLSTDGTSLLNEDYENFIQTGASNMKELVILLDADNLETTKTQTFESWLLYIGKKYDNIQVFSLKRESSVRFSSISALEQSTAYAITNMSKIKEYTMELTPITSNIIKAMDNNNAKLESLSLWVNDDNAVSQLDSLRSSSQKECIQRLVLSCDSEDEVEYAPFGRTMANLNSQLSNLVHLEIEFFMCTHTWLLDILQNLPPMLETLVYGSTMIWHEPGPIKPMTESKLKHLEITLGCHTDLNLEDWNIAFKTIFELCPNLIYFELEETGIDGKTDGRELILDFTKLGNLEKIDLNFYNIGYYTFNEAGKEGCWTDYGNKLQTEPSSATFYANLSWSSQPILNLKSGCFGRF